MNVFDLMAKLTLDKSEYESGLDTAEQSAGSFASKFASGMGTAAKAGALAIGALGTGVAVASKAFINGAGDVAEYGDKIDKASQKIGISAKAYQEWDFIAQHSGTSMDTLKTSFKTLANQAQSGAEEFKKLGLSLDDVSKMSTEDLFSAVVSGLQNMEEGTERTAVASKLLGRGAIELGALLNTSAEDTEAMRKQVHELGGVMDDEGVKAAARYQDSLQDMQYSMMGLKNNLMSQFLPSLSTVMDGIAKIFSGDSGGMQIISEGIDGLVTKISDAIPKVIEIGGQIIGMLGQSIVENAPKVVTAGTGVVLQLVQSFISGLPQVAESATQIIGTLASGLGQALPQLVPAAIEAVVTIVTTLIDNADQLIDGAFALMDGLFNGLIEGIPKVIEAIPTIISKLITSIINNAPKFLEAAIKLIGSMARGLIQGIPQLLASIPQIIGAVVNGLAQLPGKVLEIGKNVVQGLWNGISSMAGWIADKVSGFFGGIIDGAKNLLGIHSPSKVFARLGQFTAEGFGEGWDDSFSDVKRTIEGDMKFGPANISTTAHSNSSNNMSELMAKLDGLANMQIVLDTGVLVGQTVNKMDGALGNLAYRNSRGVLA